MMDDKVITRHDHALDLMLLADVLRRRGIDIPGAVVQLEKAADEIERLRDRVEGLDPPPSRTHDA